MAGGVPGFFFGLWEAKQRYGNPAVTWESLLRPSIDMAREGVEVGFSLANAMEVNSDNIKNDPGLRYRFQEFDLLKRLTHLSSDPHLAVY